jgi:UDP-N-acetylglucosamine 2-epimerase
MIELLEALNRVKMQVVLLWPNIDAGADRISKAIRVFRNEVRPEWMRVITNLSPENYLKVIAQTACAVGNSSSFVRDASYFGTPIVLVGNRQQGREKDVHVRNVPPAADEITRAVREQLAHGPYAPSTLYGDGFVSERIAEALLRLTPYVQKRLNYVYEPAQVAAAHV